MPSDVRTVLLRGQPADITRMKRVCLLFVLLLWLTSFCSAVKPGYFKGKLVSAVAGTEGPQARMVYYLRILVDRQLYFVEQRPTFFLNAYSPHEFFVNGPVLVRLGSRHLYVLRPNGKEMRMMIVQKEIVEDEAELAKLNRTADRPPSSDTVADMVDDAVQRQKHFPSKIPW